MKIALIFILLLAFNVDLGSSSIIGIDMGSEFFKVVLVKVNEPFQIVENIQSKRKTETALGFRDDERSFGADAVMKRVRNPSQTFTNLHDFIGKSYHDEGLKNFLEKYFVSYELEEDKTRQTVNFKVKYIRKDFSFSTEELFGMLFRYIQFLSEKYARSPIKECVITVPSFYGYKERLAISQAILLTNMKLLTILNGNIGAAVNYALEKKTNKTENIIFYNMGNSFTQTSLVQFTSEEVSAGNGKTNVNTKMKVLAEAWDKQLGGRNFNYNLIRYLMQRFDEYPQRKGKPSVMNNPKIAEKILAEAIRTKEILSANKEVKVQVLTLEDNLNLQEVLTRETFEKINSEEINRAYDTIAQVLTYSNKTIDDIDQIELIGGGIRVPAIMNLLKEKVGENKLGQHMNGDESVAFGTSFIAANSSSSGIRTKPLPAHYGTNYEINIRIRHFDKVNKTLCENDINLTNNFSDYVIAEDCVRRINKSTTLFKVHQNFDIIKPIALRHDGDFDVEVYQRFFNSDKEEHIMTYRLTEVDKTVKGMIIEKVTSVPPKITLKFHLNKQGILDLKATINYNITLYLSIQKGVTLGGVEVVYIPNKVEPMTEEQFNATMIEYNITNFTDSFLWKMRKDIGKSRINEVNNNLTVQTTYSYPQPLTIERIVESKKLLIELDKHDQERLKTIERRNYLETYLYEKREWYDSQEAKLYSTENEREKGSKLLNQIKEWFEEEGHIANLTTIEDKIRRMTAQYAIISTRIDRQRRLSRGINTFSRDLNRTITQGEAIRVKKPWTEEYYNKNFSVIVKEIQTWFEQIKEKQSKLSYIDEPVVTPETLYAKNKILKAQLVNLDRIQKPIIENNKINIEDMINRQSIEDLIKTANETDNSTNSNNDQNQSNSSQQGGNRNETRNEDL